MPPKRKGRGKGSRKSNSAKVDNDFTEICNGEPSTSGQPTPRKVPVNQSLCRLCEGKEGPFVQIFETEKVAKQIENLMPFRISENDDLPHTVCFRCSAKVDEVHEFIDKCIKIQQNLHILYGKSPPVINKTITKERLYWENQLKATNKSHEDVCDEVIKKAMQACIVSPLSSNGTANSASEAVSKNTTSGNSISGKSYSTTTPSSNTAKASTIDLPQDLPTPSTSRQNSSKKINNKKKKQDNNTCSVSASPPELEPAVTNNDNVRTEEEEEDDEDVVVVKDDIDREIESLPFMNIIKVYGVGLLYICKSCNRNFLNKHVVIAHSCIKNINKKPPEPKKPVAPQKIKVDAPKTVNIKYINTSNKAPEHPVLKPKPKAGPACKTGRRSAVVPTVVATKQTEKTNTNPAVMTPEQLREMYDKVNMYNFVPQPGNKYVLEKKKPLLENDNGFLQLKKTPSVSTYSKKPQTVTSATMAAAGTSESSQPYPVALFQIRKASDDAPGNGHVVNKDVPKQVKEDDKYTCNICNENFNRQQKLAVHLQAHYNSKEPPVKKRRTQ